MNCNYCFEDFDLKIFFPVKTDSNFSLCSECARYLTRKKINCIKFSDTTNIKFTKDTNSKNHELIKIIFKNFQPNEIRNICKSQEVGAFRLINNEFCKDHNIPLCSVISSHDSCTKISIKSTDFAHNIEFFQATKRRLFHEFSKARPTLISENFSFLESMINKYEKIFKTLVLARDSKSLKLKKYSLKLTSVVMKFNEKDFKFFKKVIDRIITQHSSENESAEEVKKCRTKPPQKPGILKKTQNVYRDKGLRSPPSRSSAHPDPEILEYYNSIFSANVDILRIYYKKSITCGPIIHKHFAVKQNLESVVALKGMGLGSCSNLGSTIRINIITLLIDDEIRYIEEDIKIKQNCNHFVVEHFFNDIIYLESSKELECHIEVECEELCTFTMGSSGQVVVKDLDKGNQGSPVLYFLVV